MARRASPAQQRVTFSCAFARRNCPHETTFQDAYQRTNRTRGTKILRCFPHCCPRHVDRSYCGGPVYLQVDFTSVDPDAVDDASLCVFAHFHPKAMPGLALGQHVARAMFREHQQTDTKPTGEWIGARLMASADHTSWMFEVNPSGRWYYQWESGATKAQRATEHVFEAYVMVLDAAFERCEVVAKVVSRDFKMISFRRAPTVPKLSTPEIATAGSPVVIAQEVDEDQEMKSVADQDPVPASSSTVRWIPRDSIDSAVSSDAEIASQFQTLMDSQSFSRDSSPQVDSSRLRSRNRAPVQATSTHQPGPGRTEDQDDEAAPLSLLPPPQIRRISHQIGTLVDFVQALPCSALDLVSPDIFRFVLAPFVRVGEMRSNRPPNLNALIGLSSRDLTSTTSQFPVTLATVVLRLALWILFDEELAHTQETFIERASAGLLDKVALYTSYYSWLERLANDIEGYLTTTHATATLDELVNGARQWLSGTGRPSDGSEDSESASMTGCRGLEAFVAQTREVFLADGDLQRRRAPAASVETENARVDRGDHTLALFSAVWVMDVDSIHWRDVREARESRPSPSVSSPSAFSAMWAWRQVLGVEICVDDQRMLTMSSLWSASNRRSTAAVRGSRLVLDGKPRWLRVFPCGESIDSVFIGSQRLGHYVASFRRETRELLVNLYSWPTTASRRSETHCYCFRWCLRLEPGENTLHVRVAVERGRLRRGVDTAALDEYALFHKLQSVDGWTTAASLEYEYRRR